MAGKAVVSAQDVINAVYNPDETVNLRIFEDQGSGIYSGGKIAVEAGKFSTKEDELKKHNALNRGIFWVVNAGGNDDRSINLIKAQFVEMDDGDFQEQWRKIDKFPLQPSIVIKTRKSLHVYYLMKDAEVGRFRTIQKQLVAHFGGDPMCVNESRCMRLPGFNHCKKDSVMVTCELFHPERKYTQDELAEHLPEIDTAPVAVMEGDQKGLSIVLSQCEFIKHCRDDAAVLSEAEWYAMITELTPFAGGTEKIHEYSSPHPGYDQAKTQKKINHFLQSGTGPITCKTLKEKGFDCPKMKDGSCKCKAPAALCYQPLSLDGIRAFMAGLPVRGNVVDDLQIAKSFVEEYLYNVDNVTAESYINYELRPHFNFKKDDIKSLSSLQRGLFRRHQASSGAKKNASGKDIPSWYDVSEKGFRFKPGILADDLKGSQKVFYAAEQYYRYENGVYRTITELTARNIVREKMIPEETKLSQITDAEGQWKMQIQLDSKDLNANPYIINLKNGLYNVIEDKLEDHTPDYLSTVQIHAGYDPSAQCPRFMEYLHDSLDDEMIPLMQEILGYFLIPTNRAQKAFVLVGVARSGKSVLIRTISEILLGMENVSNVSWQALNERFKPAELWGKLANTFADLPTKNIDDNGIFKALVGEDSLTVEFKNKKPFSFQSYARLLFSCNSIPKNYGDRSEGFYRRLIIIRFNHAVPEDKKDPALIDKFRDEADGIFMFALAGLKRLMENEFIFSETDANRLELQSYREDSNSCLSFVKDCCELDSLAEIGVTMLYDKYKIYCQDNGMRPYGKQTFNKELETNLSDIVRGRDSTGNKRVWKGLRLGDCID